MDYGITIQDGSGTSTHVSLRIGNRSGGFIDSLMSYLGTLKFTRSPRDSNDYASPGHLATKLVYNFGNMYDDGVVVVSKHTNMDYTLTIKPANFDGQHMSVKVEKYGSQIFQGHPRDFYAKQFAGTALFVPSDSRAKEHVVTCDAAGQWHCTCEDHTYRDRECKHIAKAKSRVGIY